MISILYGCESVKAPSLKKDSICTSSIEGYFFCEPFWQHRVPALITKDEELIFGHIIEINKESVLFDPKRESPIYNPKPKYFKNEDINLLLNESGNLIIGKIPKKYQNQWEMYFYLQNENRQDDPPYKLKLKPNQRFGYCIPPGSYYISSFVFKDKYKNKVNGVYFPRLEIIIEEGISYYLGDYYLDQNIPDFDLEVIIPCSLEVDLKSERRMNFMFGFFGGLILGSMASTIVNEMGKDNIIGIHRLQVKIRDNFSYVGSNTPKSKTFKITNKVNQAILDKLQIKE